MAEIPQKTAIGKLDSNFIAEGGIVTIDHKARPNWIPLDNYVTTPASTSTITTTEDLTTYVSIGTPLQYAIGDIYYYGIITAITSTLITISGAPLSGTIQSLEYSDESRVCQVDFYINDKFGDAANASLLDTDMTTGFTWNLPEARLVKFSNIVNIDDSGATQPKVNITINGNAVCTSNSNAGLVTAETWTSTVVDINVTNYVVPTGAVFEISTDATGTNKDSKHLTISALLVII